MLSIDGRQGEGGGQVLRSSLALAGDRAWYTVLMLLTVGPMALPLLWHSRRFSLSVLYY